MKDKYLRTLELDKVLEMLANSCSCRDTAERARELEPAHTVSEVRALLAESWDAHSLIGRYGTPRFGGVQNTSNSLRRAQAGGVLTMDYDVYMGGERTSSARMEITWRV